MANETKQVFGTSAQVTAISLAADLANGAHTYSGLTGLTMAELDNSALLYPTALAVLHSPDGFAVAPNDNSTIDLYMVRKDVDGTADDTNPPASGDLNNAEYVGSFPVASQTAANAYRKSILISLMGVTKADYFIVNNSGQTLDYVATPITVKVTPLSVVPS